MDAVVRCMREGMAYLLLGATTDRDTRGKLDLPYLHGQMVTLEAVEARTLIRYRQLPELLKYLRALQGALLMVGEYGCEIGKTAGGS